MADARPNTKQLRVNVPFVQLRTFKVTVVDGPDQSLAEDSDGGDFAIGTAVGNQLTLRDRSVSRHHCIVETTPEGILIRDLESTNGTFVDGLRIRSAYLRAACEIRVGVTTIRFELHQSPVIQKLSEEQALGDLFGVSPAMRRVFAIVPRLAASDLTILIEGETGTGKTALARIIHEQGHRAKLPFVVVDCASLPPSLIESELFGHEKGAFTGATEMRRGAFELAADGTLFLDEIGELPLDMQPKLLRVVEERSIRRLGGQRPIELSCRIIAATNRDLMHEVNAGSFRSDLYHRLNSVKVRLPPLRDRREDIELLAAHYWRVFHKSEPVGPSFEAAVRRWSARDWPGNVRELRSAVERDALLGAPTTLTEELGPPSSQAPPPPIEAQQAADFSVSYREAKNAVVDNWERNYLDQLMLLHGGNISRAAQAVRTDRNYLRDRLRKHGLAST